MNYATQYPTNHYPPSQGPGSAPLPPEGAHLHQQHQGGQTSPVVPSQDQRYQQSPNQPHPQMYGPAYGMQQYMTPGQAAAMATVAAAGPAGSYYERAPRTPTGAPSQMPASIPSQQQQAHAMQGRRMSEHGNAPHVNNVGNHHGPQPGGPPPPARTSMSQQGGMPPPSAQHGPPPPPPPSAPQNASPDPPAQASGQAEEAPLYVNAKQFHRILKRRVARQRLEEALRLTSKGRRPYLHESRHRHAMRRPRGPGGRFLTADEVAKMEATGELPTADDDKENAGAKHKKRKSKGGGEPPSKKKKGGSEDDEGDEDDEEDEDEGDD